MCVSDRSVQSMVADRVKLIEVINIAACVSALFVWGTANLAYIRYYFWFVISALFATLFIEPFARLKKHKAILAERDGYAHFNRWESVGREYAAKTFLFSLQPFPAIIGFASCFVVMFIFTTAL